MLVSFQTEGEKTELGERRREAEVERAAAREDVARTQKEMMNLLAEKQALESSHSHLQDLCQKLEAELSLLQKEKAQALEKHSQVRDPQPCALLLAPITWENYVDVINSFQQVHGACCHIKMYRRSRKHLPCFFLSNCI